MRPGPQDVKQEVRRQLAEAAADLVRGVREDHSGPTGFTVLLLAFAALVRMHPEAPSDVRAFAVEAEELAMKFLAHLDDEVRKHLRS